MTKQIFSVLTVAALVSACGGDADADGDVVSQDTSVSTIQSADTVDQPVVVPTTDSVVTTTTVTQDTIEGSAVVTDTPATARP